MSGHITMSDKEQQRIIVLEQLIRKEIKSGEAAQMLGISTRQIRRQKRRYHQQGVAGLVHQNRGKPSNRKIHSKEIDRVMHIIREHYTDFGPTFALEKLVEHHHVHFKVERLRQAMIACGIWTAKRRKKASIHQLRVRRDHEGELIQVDGSPHDWFEGRGDVGVCTLLVFVDDATGNVLWLEFCRSESTMNYFHAMEGYLTTHGRPLALYSDKHGVFRVNKAKDGMSDETVGLTQFGRACQQLDIEMIFANTPQAKGRVERMNETFQDRLVKELRLRGISSIEVANHFVQEEYMNRFNQQFGVKPKEKANLHRPLLETQTLSDILTIEETRVISKQLSIQYNQVVYQIQTKRSAYTLRHKKIKIRHDQHGTVTLWDGKEQLKYTTLKKQPRQTVANSKQLTHLMNEKVNQYRKPKNWWETPLEEMTQEIYY